MKRDPIVGTMVHACFGISFLSAFINTVGDIVYFSWNTPNDGIHSIILFVIWISAGVFFESLVLTYIVRLHTTFKSSLFRMSTTLIVMFSIIFISGCVIWIIGVAFLCFTDLIEMAYCLMMSCFLFYLICG